MEQPRAGEGEKEEGGKGARAAVELQVLRCGMAKWDGLTVLVFALTRITPSHKSAQFSNEHCSKQYTLLRSGFLLKSVHMQQMISLN